ncbi:MAG TPA: BCAM0308 family protein [Candidatus Binatia bacterium]
MNSGTRRYNTGYKKNGNVARDIYLPRRAPKGLLSCRGCGCIYFRGRWTLEPSREILKRVELRDGVRPTYCPACQKMRDRYWQGVVQISGIGAGEKREVLKLLRNEETRAREKNPLERIVRIVEKENGLRVETTTEKLAQRLGRSLGKARGGSVTYKWSHRNKFARVVWEKSREKQTAGG